MSAANEEYLNRLAVAAFRAYYGAAVDGRLLVGWQLTLWRDVAQAVLTAHYADGVEAMRAKCEAIGRTWLNEDDPYGVAVGIVRESAALKGNGEGK